MTSTGTRQGETLAHCLGLLDLDDGECLSFGVQRPGGEFEGSQQTVAELKALDLSTLTGYNAWCGLQPMARKAYGRGSEADVLRLAALFADLDVGPTKLPTDQACIEVIKALSDMLGTRPVYVVASGHGYQPVWAVDRHTIDGNTDPQVEDMPAMRALIRRWGRLVKQVAATHGGTADSVFEASRVLRIPGTVNLKDPEVPVLVTAMDSGGAPVSVEQIRDVLDTYVADEGDEDTGPAFEGAEVPEVSCRYAMAMMQGWKTDLPDERHPWATRNGMKLVALHRLGCLSEHDLDAGVEILASRLKWLCANHGKARPFEKTEVIGKPDSIIESAKRKAATYSEVTLREKVGNHDHIDPDDLSWIPGQWDDADAPKRSEVVPAVHPAVWHGPAGEYVKAIAEHTESDPLAVLVQVLAWSGCRMGRSVWIQHGNTRHYPLIWPLIVGRTSTGRKGNSSNDSLSALSAHNALPRRRSGLSSGEGLVEAFMPSKNDETTPDERLLIVETEWEAVLARCRREGNTLSAVLRDAWDGQALSTMNAAGASRNVPHHALTVVGHITPQALRNGMTGEDLTNGFLNRFLILSVHRPRLVPWPREGGESAQSALSSIASLCSAMTTGPFTLTTEARQVYIDWYVRYAETSEALPERVAMATARAVANLLRTSLIYAILDGSDRTVEVDHLIAAMALVENSVACARQLLDVGKAGLDGKILAALREHGPMSRTEIRDHFSRHVSAPDLSEALDALVETGEVTRSKDTDTGGRPADTYSARESGKRGKRANPDNHERKPR